MRKYIYSIFAIAWIIILTFLSLISLEGAPNLGFSFADKLIHGLVYFIFAILWFFSFSKGITNKFFQKNAIIASAIFAIIYGICVEIMQETLVSNRQGDWQDVLANTIGTILAIILIKYIVLNSRKLKTEN
ncbi:VanZ family protein [Kordia sp. YSTF-M3]|uniref:VanZ family protein n=1 Tax=Kordia aestuariivivens TaxID=2759037 RepID=A0ABR7Q3F7_9FLAO|nr:VanZ family protein [Kordia aestuariivivens]MBC8753084.1 VanZ family protein [Kordia aestuariivivens]